MNAPTPVLLVIGLIGLIGVVAVVEVGILSWQGKPAGEVIGIASGALGALSAMLASTRNQQERGDAK